MLKIMLLAINKREMQILEMAFTQSKIEVILSKPTYSNYIKLSQYVPDIIMIELPHICGEQIQFLKMITKHKKAKKIPVIGYGNSKENSLKKGIFKLGIRSYVERPLKFSVILNLVSKYLKQLNKETNFEKKDVRNEREGDVSKILNIDTKPVQKIELMVKHISGLLAFPFTVTKVLQLAGNNKSGAGDLAQVIQADPVISTNILKVSNSVLFASLNRRINSIKDAIVRIGFNETKRVVLGMSVMKLFDSDSKSAGFNRVNFWFHCLASAIISEKISKRIGTLNKEEIFLAGLLHDFGIILLDEFFPEILKQSIDDTTNRGSRFIDSEKSFLGITHNDVVKELFTKWKIPDKILESLTAQHNILLNKNITIDQPGKATSVCVALGNILAKSFIFGRSCDEYVIPVDNEIFRIIKMPAGPNKNFEEEVLHEIDIYSKLLKLDQDVMKERAQPQIDDKRLKIGIYNASKSLFIPAKTYLDTQGHEVSDISKPEKSAQYDSKFDIVLAYTDLNTTTDMINSLTNILEKIDEKKPDKKPDSVPILAFIDGNSKLNCPEISKTISLMPKDYDLRLLDQNIQKTIEREIIEFIPGTLQSNESNTLNEKPEAKSTDTETAEDAAEPEKKENIEKGTA